MVLSEQAIRNWKLATAALTATVAIHSTLYAEYEMPPHLKGEKHIFTDLQQWYRAQVDQHVWRLPPPNNMTEQDGNNDRQQ